VKNEQYSWFLLEKLMNYGMVLPLTLTMDSNKRWLRVLGIPLMLIWFLPAGIICCPFMLLLLFALIFERAWDGC